MSDISPNKYASIRWISRWNEGIKNGNSTVAALSNTTPKDPEDKNWVLATLIGNIYFNDEDATSIITSLETAVTLLKTQFTATQAELAARELLKEGRKILAIKRYREMMYDNGVHIGLKEAKEFVESLDQRNTR